MNFYLFADILIAILAAWTGATIAIGLYYSNKGASVKIAAWAFIIFFVSVAYGFARFFS